jgi:thioredoxin-like negative regulator of GroEL
MAPIFESLATKYPRAVFLKVDVDECQETAGSQGVSAMPTFIFYRNRVKLDRLQGADPNALEAKIQQYYGSEETEEDSGVAGHVIFFSFFL